jgi:hypothetical protein
MEEKIPMTLSKITNQITKPKTSMIFGRKNPLNLPKG